MIKVYLKNINRVNIIYDLVENLKNSFDLK